MFGRKDIDDLFSELRRNWFKSSDWEQLNRDSHLGIARSDAGVTLGDIDPRVIALIQKYKPNDD